jgi:RND family efflux transporter MFP subunit
VVAKAVTKKVAAVNEFTTRIEAKESVEVRARVNGYLQETLFKDGDMVKKDDVLFVIDPKPFEAEVQKAQGQLKEAESKVELTSANAKRADQLIKENVISRVEYEKLVTDNQVATAAVQAARGALETAQLNLKYSRVTAPFTGKASKGAFSNGNLVEAGKDVLTTIVTLDPVQASFDIDERALLEARRSTIARGGSVGSGTNSLTVGLVLTDGNEYPQAGRIDFIDNQVNTSTGTIRARAVFPNPHLLLTPGMFARVRLGGDEKEALLIPERAIGTDQSDKYVYVINDQNIAEFRKVKPGVMSGGMRVIDEGLKPGERIVVDGLLRVRPGSPVRVREEGGAPAADKAGKH